VIIRRPGQRLHLGTSLQKVLTRHVRKGLGPNRACVHTLVQEDLEGLPELQSRGIQIAEGPESFLFAGVMGRPDDVANQQIEEVQGIIHRDRLEGPCKGQECRDAAFCGHACQCLGARSSALAG
jgi:hypothetical protein